jgi:hypothetical protein
MKVFVFLLRNDNSGSIDIFEVDEEKFIEIYQEIAPSSNEDWNYLLSRLKEIGKRVQTLVPDFSFSVNLDEL